MKHTFLPMLFVGLAGCGALEEILQFETPSGTVQGVELVDAPSAAQLLGYGCAETIGETLCSTVLPTPALSELALTFDLIVELENPNNFPVPLVETLVGFSAFGEENLGTVCVQFCDPDVPDCQPTVNAEGGCEDAPGVSGAGDLVPTVEELIDFAQDPSLEGDWLFIPPNSTRETQLQFDVGIEPLLSVAGTFLDRAIDDVFSGQVPSLDVPFTVEGMLFFDVPLLGRRGVPFGPISDEWQL